MSKIVYNSKTVATAAENYPQMANKPMINGVELVGNVTFNELGLFPVGYIIMNTTGLKPNGLGTWTLLGTEEKFDKTFYIFEKIS